MRTTFLFMLLLAAQNFLAQSKNVQIEKLTIKSDSLQLLLISERNQCSAASRKSEQIQDSLSQELQQTVTRLDQSLKLNQTFGEDIQNMKLLNTELKATIAQQNTDISLLKRELLNDSTILVSKQSTINDMSAQLEKMLKLNENLSQELKQAKNVIPAERVICETNAISSTCTYRNYVFTTLNKRPEDEWKYKNVRDNLYSIVYLKEGNQLNAIDNYELINSLENELVTLVNGKAVLDYQKLIADGKRPSCFEDKDYQSLTLYNLEFTLNENGMVIYYSFFGDDDNCDEFWSSYTLTLEQAKRYLR